MVGEQASFPESGNEIAPSAFHAYPNRFSARRWRWTVVAPLSILVMLSIYLYILVQQDEAPRMTPAAILRFLPNYDLGLWKRAADNTTEHEENRFLKSPSGGGSHKEQEAEVAILRAELRLERSRSAAQLAELNRLQSVTALAPLEANVTSTTNAVLLTTRYIPRSLFREPPSPEDSTAISKFANTSHSNLTVATAGPLDTVELVDQDSAQLASVPASTSTDDGNSPNRITVKTGSQEIVVEIGAGQQHSSVGEEKTAILPSTQREDELAASLPAPPAPQIPQQMTPEQQLLPNETVVPVPSGIATAVGMGTQITVESQKQSITINVIDRDDSGLTVANVSIEDVGAASLTTTPVNNTETLPFLTPAAEQESNRQISNSTVVSEALQQVVQDSAKQVVSNDTIAAKAVNAAGGGTQITVKSQGQSITIEVIDKDTAGTTQTYPLASNTSTKSGAGADPADASETNITTSLLTLEKQGPTSEEPATTTLPPTTSLPTSSLPTSSLTSATALPVSATALALMTMQPEVDKVVEQTVPSEQLESSHDTDNTDAGGRKDRYENLAFRTR